MRRRCRPSRRTAPAPHPSPLPITHSKRMESRGSASGGGPGGKAPWRGSGRSPDLPSVHPTTLRTRCALADAAVRHNIGGMRYGRVIPLVLAVLVAAPAFAADDGDVHATYHTYAAGLHVANVKAGFGLGPWSYQVQLAYHTTGLIGFFFRGHQVNTVTGSWDDAQPAPHEFFGDGVWRGLHRITLIDYDRGMPLIRSLVPPNETERQKVPPDLRANTVDTLSALAELMRNVASSGRCETTVRTYDGRRVTEVVARTVGTETLAPTDRSTFSGQDAALRLRRAACWPGSCSATATRRIVARCTAPPGWRKWCLARCRCRCG